MKYVALRRRQKEDARDRQKPVGFWHDVKHNPYFSSTVGLIFGFPAAAISVDMVHSGIPFFAALFVPWIPPAALFARGFLQLGRRGSRGVEPKLGSEKQLLLAILDSGGSITPVEAALETSLTVDEADEILSRFADRGHLMVESRDGSLHYTLPGRRSGGPGGRAVPSS